MEVWEDGAVCAEANEERGVDVLVEVAVCEEMEDGAAWL